MPLSAVKNKNKPDLCPCKNEGKNNLLCIHFFVSSTAASGIVGADIEIPVVFPTGIIEVTERILQDNSSLFSSHPTRIYVLINEK